MAAAFGSIVSLNSCSTPVATRISSLKSASSYRGLPSFAFHNSPARRLHQISCAGNFVSHAGGGSEPPIVEEEEEVRVSPPAVDVPKIDISHLISPSPSTAEAEEQKLRSAFSTFGCCMVVNHEMTRELVDSMHGISNEIFELPEEEKSKYARPAGGWQGYGFGEFPKDDELGDWIHRYTVKISPKRQRKMEYWPEHNPSNFRKIMEECSNKLEKLTETVLKGMARSLDLEDKIFVDEMGEARLIVRCNYYPRCDNPDKVFGLYPHGDATVLTYVLMDKQVQGLQLFREEEWVNVALPSEDDDDAILIIMGDVGEVRVV